MAPVCSFRSNRGAERIVALFCIMDEAANTKSTRTFRAASPRLKRIALMTLCAALTGVAVICALALRRPPLPSARFDNAAASARLTADIERARAKAASGVPQTLRIDESELNSLITNRLRSSRNAVPQDADGSVHDLRFKLTDDRLQVFVAIQLHGQELIFSIEGRLYSSGGHLRFDPISAHLGSLPIPRTVLEDMVQRIMSVPQNYQAMRLPSNIDDLRIESGKIIIVLK